MSVAISCTGCGKSLTVKDEFIGKRLKCPQCGATFTAAAAQARSPGKAKDSDVPRIHLSPGIIALIIAVVSIVGLLLFWNLGPGKVRAQWATLQTKAEDDVKDVVDRALQAQLSSEGEFNASVAHATPHSLDITFIISPLPLTMPDTVGFAGTTTQGGMMGRYHTKTGEVEADVEIGGLSFPGAGVQRHGAKTVHVTGRNKNGAVTAEINGRKAELDWSRKKAD